VTTNNSGLDFRQWQGTLFHGWHGDRPVSSPTGTVGLLPEVKLKERGAVRSRPPSAEVKNAYRHNPTRTYICKVPSILIYISQLYCSPFFYVLPLTSPNHINARIFIMPACVNGTLQGVTGTWCRPSTPCYRCCYACHFKRDAESPLCKLPPASSHLEEITPWIINVSRLPASLTKYRIKYKAGSTITASVYCLESSQGTSPEGASALHDKSITWPRAGNGPNTWVRLAAMKK
jgi:hypothetical protein